MRKKINKALVIVNHTKSNSASLMEEICDHLQKIGITGERSTFCKDHSELDLDNTDLAISLGGDGTVLFTAGLVAAKRIPILAVNLGDFGFITEISQSEWQSTLHKYLEGETGVSKRMMVRARVFRHGESIAEFHGLNDSVISSSGISKIVKLQVSIAEDRLGEYRADGIMIATPTGSTAYSLSAGGPILDPEMDAFILNPICPFTLSNRTIVLPGEEKITVTVKHQQRTDIILTVDGQKSITLEPDDMIEFDRAKEKALIVRSDQRTFYEVLRSKLKWSGGPDA